MKKRSVVSFLLFVLYAAWSCAGLLDKISVKPFPLLGQLPSNKVYCLYQDREGIFWLGTTDGLCRYDGYGLHVFRSSPMYPDLLPHNDIKEITETKDGKLLIGTQKGMCVWDRKANRFISFTDSLLTDYEIRSIVADDEGYVWVGSYKKLVRISPDLKEVESFDSSLPVTSVNMIYKDHAGTIWVGFWEKGLYRYNRTINRFERMPRVGKTDNPFRLCQDESGTYWLSVWGEGMFRMDLDAGANVCYVGDILAGAEDKDMENLKYAFCLYQDKHWGCLWLLGYYGLTVARTEDGRLNVIPSEKLAAQTNNLFNRIYGDRDGNIWLSASGSGAYQLVFSDAQITNLSLPPLEGITGGISPIVRGVFKDNTGLFWINYDRLGLGWYNPAGNSLSFYRDMVSSEYQNDLGDVSVFFSPSSREDEVWVGAKFFPKIYVFLTRGG